MEKTKEKPFAKSLQGKDVINRINLRILVAGRHKEHLEEGYKSHPNSFITIIQAMEFVEEAKQEFLKDEIEFFEGFREEVIFLKSPFEDKLLNVVDNKIKELKKSLS